MVAIEDALYQVARMNKVVDETAVMSVREDFPVLASMVRGKPLVYFDNAATTQKPKLVIDRLSRFYAHENANIHRGLHFLSENATRSYEEARQKVAQFLGAADSSEIVFTRGATESINLVAQTFGRKTIGQGDVILVSGMEHHANIVPWQMLAEEKGAEIRVWPVEDDGTLDLAKLPGLLSGPVKLLALTHVSNALGTVNPVEEIVKQAHQCGVKVLVDGAQAVAHFPVNMQSLDADFYVFSGHKLFGPTGIGVLYGQSVLLKDMPPYQGGGDMIERVSFAGTTFAAPPARFEAGTPHIAGAIGLGEAIDYLNTVGWQRIEAAEEALLRPMEDCLRGINGLRLIGQAKDRVGAFSFAVEGVHPHDLATFLDQDGVAVRAGHHCTQPLMERFGLPATTRASLAFYNTREEIELFSRAMHRALKLLL